MKALRIIVCLTTALLLPSALAFLSAGASRPSSHQKTLVRVHARKKQIKKLAVVNESWKDPSELPRTIDPSNLLRTLDPSTLPRTLDPSEFQRTLDPADLPVDPNAPTLSTLPQSIDPTAADSQPALIETIGGGTSMIFEMARRMLVWDETETKIAAETKKKQTVLPRWHPHSGISDVNPSFRTEAPIMNNQGYASTIWRNVRKRNKPSLWRHALRTYDRMEAASHDSKTSVLRIERSTIHHEGAMLACAKLGLWKEAMEIYTTVERKARGANGRTGEGVTDSMVFSLVKACVRSCKKLGSTSSGSEPTTLQERRAPIDAAVDVVKFVHAHHFPVVARHLNPLAAAYQSLGLLEDAKALLQQNLEDRSIGPEPEDGDESLNIHDLSAKDKASYALLVKGAIVSGSWADAVEELRNMTDAGLYPTNSHLHSWTEVSERKTHSRTTRSWKKKRDEYWLESVN